MVYRNHLFPQRGTWNHFEGQFARRLGSHMWHFVRPLMVQEKTIFQCLLLPVVVLRSDFVAQLVGGVVAGACIYGILADDPADSVRESLMVGVRRSCF